MSVYEDLRYDEKWVPRNLFQEHDNPYHLLNGLHRDRTHDRQPGILTRKDEPKTTNQDIVAHDTHLTLWFFRFQWRLAIPLDGHADLFAAVGHCLHNAGGAQNQRLGCPSLLT